MRKKIIIGCILSLVVVITTALIFKSCGRKTETPTAPTIIVKSDTIIKYEYKGDTVYVEDIKYVPQIHTDTVVKNNVVYVRDSAVVYCDSTANYDISISAVRLNWYKVDLHIEDTIQKATISPIVIQPKEKKKHLHFTPQVGYGYGILNKKPDIYVGVGISYEF